MKGSEDTEVLMEKGISRVPLQLTAPSTRAAIAGVVFNLRPSLKSVAYR